MAAKLPHPRAICKQKRILLFYPIITGNLPSASRSSVDGPLIRQCYYSLMEATGFVLAGGGSTRMGRDKAFLAVPWNHAGEVRGTVVEQAAGAVVLIGDPVRYAAIGYPVYPDKIPRCGPMGGIYTALSVTATDWNLVVACDMPQLSTPVLRRLLEARSAASADCIAATSAGRAGTPVRRLPSALPAGGGPRNIPTTL